MYSDGGRSLSVTTMGDNLSAITGKIMPISEESILREPVIERTSIPVEQGQGLLPIVNNSIIQTYEYLASVRLCLKDTFLQLHSFFHSRLLQTRPSGSKHAPFVASLLPTGNLVTVFFRAQPNPSPKIQQSYASSVSRLLGKRIEKLSIGEQQRLTLFLVLCYWKS